MMRMMKVVEMKSVVGTDEHSRDDEGSGDRERGGDEEGRRDDEHSGDGHVWWGQ